MKPGHFEPSVNKMIWYGHIYYIIVHCKFALETVFTDLNAYVIRQVNWL